MEVHVRIDGYNYSLKSPACEWLYEMAYQKTFSKSSLKVEFGNQYKTLPKKKIERSVKNSPFYPGIQPHRSSSRDASIATKVPTQHEVPLIIRQNNVLPDNYFRVCRVQ